MSLHVIREERRCCNKFHSECSEMMILYRYGKTQIEAKKLSKVHFHNATFTTEEHPLAKRDGKSSAVRSRFQRHLSKGKYGEWYTD